MRSCQDTTPDELFQAISQFNNRDWFECHETLEDLWIAEKGEVRIFYQGVLQIAVALHHWRNGNYGGATGLLERGTELLSRVADECQHVDVSGLRADSLLVLKELESLGRERMGELATDRFPRIRVVGQGRAGRGE